MWTYNNTNELNHHGVMGMHWGHKKARPTTNASKVASAHTAYKDAKKEYKSANKQFDKAWSKGTTGWGAYGPKRHENEKAINDARNRFLPAHAAHKAAKKAYKKELKADNENYSDKDRAHDQFVWGRHMAKQVNKGMNKGLTRNQVKKRELGKAVAGAAVGALAGAAVHQLANNPKARDAGRKVLTKALKMAGHRNIQWLD